MKCFLFTWQMEASIRPLDNPSFLLLYSEDGVGRTILLLLLFVLSDSHMIYDPEQQSSRWIRASNKLLLTPALSSNDPPLHTIHFLSISSERPPPQLIFFNSLHKGADCPGASLHLMPDITSGYTS